MYKKSHKREVEICPKQRTRPIMIYEMLVKPFRKKSN